MINIFPKYIYLTSGKDKFLIVSLQLHESLITPEKNKFLASQFTLQDLVFISYQFYRNSSFLIVCIKPIDKNSNQVIITLIKQLKNCIRVDFRLLSGYTTFNIIQNKLTFVNQSNQLIKKKIILLSVMKLKSQTSLNSSNTKTLTTDDLYKINFTIYFGSKKKTSFYTSVVILSKGEKDDRIIIETCLNNLKYSYGLSGQVEIFNVDDKYPITSNFGINTNKIKYEDFILLLRPVLSTKNIHSPEIMKVYDIVIPSVSSSPFVEVNNALFKSAKVFLNKNFEELSINNFIKSRFKELGWISVINICSTTIENMFILKCDGIAVKIITKENSVSVIDNIVFVT